MKRLVLMLALATTFVAVRDARAQSLEVYLQPGIVSDYFTGEVGRYMSGSVGVAATQGVRYGWLGAYVGLGTSYHLTNQPPPPFTRGLQTFTVSAGLRLHVPLDPVTPIVGLEYASLGVVSNPLTQFTGDRTHFNGVGGHIAARISIRAPIYLELAATLRNYVDMRHTPFSAGGVVAIGISGLIRR